MIPNNRRKQARQKKIAIGVTIASALVFLLFVLLIVFVAVPHLNKQDEGKKRVGAVVTDHDTDEGKKRVGAVVTDHDTCADVGRYVLLAKGSAMDAIVATQLCQGLAFPHSMGLGGGFFMLYYSKQHNNVTVIDAREEAPSAAHRDMFAGMPAKASQIGGLAVSAPGELRGLAKAHAMFGKLPWERVVTPTAELAEEGLPMTAYLKYVLDTWAGTCNDSQADPLLKSLYCGEQVGLEAGMIVKRPRLAAFLRRVAEEGAEVMYTGEFAEKIAQEVQEKGGILSKEDLAKYTVHVREPFSVALGEDTLYTAPPPSSGPVMALILNIMDEYGLTPASVATPEGRGLTDQRLVEAFKFAFAYRAQLGDPGFADLSAVMKELKDEKTAQRIRKLISDTATHNASYYFSSEPTYNVDDAGTATSCVIGPDGDVAVYISSINLLFGAGFVSESTGIVFGDSMDDFSQPNATNYFGIEPSEVNFIAPGKRPLSSMTPALVLDAAGNPKIVAGSAGGPRIITTVAGNLMNYLWLGQSEEETILRKRIHHQLMPNQVEYEKGFDQAQVQQLQQRGHATVEKDYISIAALLTSRDGEVGGAADTARKGGKVAYVTKADLEG